MSAGERAQLAAAGCWCPTCERYPAATHTGAHHLAPLDETRAVTP